MQPRVQHTNFSRSQIQSVVLTSVLILLTGCFSLSVKDPAALAIDNQEDITVSTKDGLQYSFDANEYTTTIDSVGVTVVTGRGKQYRQGQSQFEWFEGSIPVSSIERVSSIHTTTFFYVLLITGGVSVGLLLWLAMQFRGHGPGG